MVFYARAEWLWVSLLVGEGVAVYQSSGMEGWFNSGQVRSILRTKVGVNPTMVKLGHLVVLSGVVVSMCTELPKLVEAPTVTNITCSKLSVVWLPWSPSSDVGSDTLSISSYTSVAATV